jgi:hypothetical protein
MMAPPTGKCIHNLQPEELKGKRPPIPAKPPGKDQRLKASEVREKMLLDAKNRWMD